MNNKFVYIFLTILTPAILLGQAVPPPVPPPPPPGLPIDSGVIFLFLAGIVLGVKKLKSR